MLIFGKHQIQFEDIRYCITSKALISGVLKPFIYIYILILKMTFSALFFGLYFAVISMYIFWEGN